jgi:sarcosine oxidase
LRSLPHWKSLAARCEQTIFHETGVLAISDGTSDFVTQSGHSLQRMNIEHEMLDAAQLVKHYPQIGIKPNDIGIFEPHSGTLMARRGIQVLVDEMVTSGLEYRVAAALPPSSKGPLNAITTASRDLISAGTFVFACGPWLPKVFPALLGRAVMPERAEVYFLGVAPGDLRFSPPSNAHLDLPEQRR